MKRVNNNKITWINFESSGKEAQLDKNFTIVSQESSYKLFGWNKVA